MYELVLYQKHLEILRISGDYDKIMSLMCSFKSIRQFRKSKLTEWEFKRKRFPYEHQLSS